MPSVSEELATFVSNITVDTFDEAVRRQASELLIDTVGCSIGAFTSAPVKSLRRTYEGYTSESMATVVGSGEATTVENAALINASMARYLDYNDCYMSTGAACHPSDHIMALLAVAEAEEASGAALAEAIVTAYEVEARGLDECHVRVNGFDYVAWGAYSSVAAVGKLMGLTEAELTDAFGIVGASNNPLLISRRGNISMWKGIAHPYVTHNAIQACQMARNGVTGPTEIFEGEYGFFDAVGETPFRFSDAPDPDDYRIMETSIKSFAAGYYIHSPVTGALQLLDEHDIDPDDIDAVDVEIFEYAADALATPEKWGHDQTRETADHSIPYTVAVAIVDGEVTPRQYETDRLRGSDVHAVMEKMTVSGSEALTAHREDHPRHIPSVTTISVGSETYRARVDAPLGHPDRPMTSEQIEAKMRTLCEGYLSAEQVESALAACRTLVDLDRVDSIVDELVV